jgi:isoleucyl-tRNA synthetase
MDYSKTLNLPKTDFKMKANLRELEPRIQRYWEEIDIYSLLRRNSKGRPRYILHDGPPYANGDIHMGHALNKILKDIIIKHKSMQGFDAPYVPGWDCHGLPIEYKVMEEVGKDRLSKIETRERCRKYALHYVKVQREQFKRLGIFGDWDHAYLTLSNEYSAWVLDAFGKIVKEGYVYRSLRPVYWCPSCKTALAEAEIEYREISSPSIYVRFPAAPQPPLHEASSILIWTTTPWTLPANVAVAFHPSYEYLSLETDGKIVVMAEDLVEEVFSKAKKKMKVLRRFKGSQLEGITLQHPFIERDVRGVVASYVTRDTGTGCVHIAPGHGIEDYEIGLKYDLPVITPVDEDGRFTDEVEDFKGRGVFEADDLIIDLLERGGYLFHKEEITHSYPHCWRCKNPLIFRATDQWFIRLDFNDLRGRCLDWIDKVEWIPRWGRDRFYNTINSRSDWCISRQRAWGIPIPALICLRCGSYLLDPRIIDLVRDLVRIHGTGAWFEREVEAFLPHGIKCSKCGAKRFKKEEDILDVWFDSGVSHQAVLDQMDGFPSDLYLEGSDQHRGWFQSSMITAMAIKGEPPYRAVLTHGFMLDENGVAMSKSRGNVISPMEVISKYGADVLRLWVSSEDYRGDVSLGEEILKRMVESYRKIRNTARFILGNLYDFDPTKDEVKMDELLLIDRYILNELQFFIKDIGMAYERFQFHRVYHLLNNFTSKTLSSLYFEILKDRLYTWGKSSVERRAAQWVLYQILDALTRIIAPILSFTSEEIWGYLKEKRGGLEESVHLASYPISRPEYLLDEKEYSDFKRLLSIREDVLLRIEERRAEGMVGSSLEAAVRIGASGEDLRILLHSKEELPSIFIVSQVEVSEEEGLKIVVERAKGRKCIRCWNISESVGKDTVHSQICSRCVEVIKEEIW